LVKLTGDGALVEFASAVDDVGAAVGFQQSSPACQHEVPAERVPMRCVREILRLTSRGTGGLWREKTMLTRAMAMLALMSAQAAAFELSLPVACEMGRECFIQQYFDHDPGPEAHDYACGGETYNGHDGTDIRLRSTADVQRSVGVVAAAAGMVVATRDGMADKLIRSQADRAEIANRECGNGVLIAHGEDWQTQYCHMRRGSIAVKQGDRVEPGQKLGEIGYSGDAAFPHVHLTVRKDGKVLDPFQPDSTAACGEPKQSLWSSTALEALAYREGDLLALGFSMASVQLEELESDKTQSAVPTSESPALVAYMWAINLQKEDKITISLLGPDGSELSKNSAALDRNKAQYVLFAGASGHREDGLLEPIKRLSRSNGMENQQSGRPKR